MQHRLCLMVWLCLAAMSADLLGQANQRAVFVANDGNLEGSVTSYLLDGDDAPVFVEKLVIGSTPSTSNPVPGTNAHTVAISPNGRFLAVGHTTSADDFEQLSIVAVHSDATISLFATFQVPDSPFKLEWLSDDFLAVLTTSLSAVNEVSVYQFIATETVAPQLNLISKTTTGSFSTSMVVHPIEKYFYVQSSFGDNRITSISYDDAGMVTSLETLMNGSSYPLGLGVSPNGKWLYSGGGISSGGNLVQGFNILGDGTLEPHAQSYTSPGSSPKQVVVTTDNAFAIVAHGTDATFRSFAVDSEDGSLTPTGFSFDVGIQGSLAEIEVFQDLLLALDNDTSGGRGLYSFTVNPDGSFTQNGSLVDSTGSRPTELVAWLPLVAPCPADLSGDGVIDEVDLGLVYVSWSEGLLVGDLDGSGLVDIRDLILLRDAFGACD